MELLGGGSKVMVGSEVSSGIAVGEGGKLTIKLEEKTGAMGVREGSPKSAEEKLGRTRSKWKEVGGEQGEEVWKGK